MQTESFLKSIGTAVIWKGLDRVAGMVKHIIIAATIGLSAQLDVFYMALALLGVFVFSWASMIDVVAVPSMVKAWQENKKNEFTEIASGLFSFVIIGSGILSLILYSSKDLLASIAIGFEVERRQLLSDAMRWLLPVILLYIPLRFLGAVLRSVRIFTPFYQAEFLTALFVLICVAVFQQDEHVLLWSFSIGVSVAFIFLLIRSKSLIFPLSNPFSKKVQQSLRLAPGILILQGAHYIYVLTDRMFVSFLPEGSVSALAYAMTLVSILPGVISLSGSFITVIAEQDCKKDRSERINSLLSMVILIALGSTCFLLMVGPSMVKVLLQRGMFSEASTEIVTTSIAAYSWMVLPLFLIGPLDQIFQVERRIGYMVGRTVIGMLTNIILNAWFLFGLGWGLFGIALATSISYWVMLAAGLQGLILLGYRFDWSSHFKWSGWIAIFLALIYCCSSFISEAIGDGLLNLLISSALLASTLLLSGIIYPREEGMLVRKTLLRCIPKPVKL